MTRRPRVVFLLESTRPSGTATMAVRRLRALGLRVADGLCAMSTAGPRPPAGSPLRDAVGMTGLAGEARLARSDVLVTTSPRSLGSAIARRRPGTRIVHFVHQVPGPTLADDIFQRSAAYVSRIVVPVSVDPARFAEQADLDPRRVVAADDFIGAADAPLSTARNRVLLAPGRLDSCAAAADLVEAFRLARPRLPGWQLRIAGDGAGTAVIEKLVERHDLFGHVVPLGVRYDLAADYLDAGVVVRTEPDEVNGLAVLEALAAGVPVLGASRVPAVARYVEHGATGWVTDRCDAVALAETMVAVGDDEHRAELAANARTAGTALVDDSGVGFADVIEQVLAEPVPSGERRVR